MNIVRNTLLKLDELLYLKNKPYAAAVGTHNWIFMTTRQDIGFAKNICGRYASNP